MGKAGVHVLPRGLHPSLGTGIDKQGSCVPQPGQYLRHPKIQAEVPDFLPRIQLVLPQRCPIPNAMGCPCVPVLPARPLLLCNCNVYCPSQSLSEWNGRDKQNEKSLGDYVLIKLLLT